MSMKTITIGKIDPSIKEVLKKLVSVDLDFNVVGGLLCQYYLKDHARYTKDVDIVFYSEPKVVEEKLKNAFGEIYFSYDEETENFYEPSFTCFSKVNGLNGQIEGKRISFFSDIRVEQYFYEGVMFWGACIEYVIAEKLVSLLNELTRPYKHLVDIYSFTKIDQSHLNKEEIKKYVLLINEQENKYRKSANLKEYILPKRIPENKEFKPPFAVPTFQSKYNVCKEEMIECVNEWLKTIL